MPKTIYTFLFFRIKQLLRTLREIGIFHFLLLSPVLIIAVLGTLQHIMTSRNFSSSIFLLIIILSIHFSRKDRFFLEQLESPLFLTFTLEYFLGCIPFILCFIFWEKWYDLLILGTGMLLICLVKPLYSNHSKRKLSLFINDSLIPLHLFEWRSGFRKHRIEFILLYVSGLVLTIYPITLPVILFLMALGISQFFQIFENKDLLLSVNAEQKLLKKKSVGSLRLFNLLMLPHYVLFVIQHNTYQLLMVLFIVSILSQMIIVFSICMKYKNYRFGHYKIYSNIPLIIFIVSMSIPFLWPLTIIMLIQFWKKAQTNLMQHYV